MGLCVLVTLWCLTVAVAVAVAGEICSQDSMRIVPLEIAYVTRGPYFAKGPQVRLRGLATEQALQKGQTIMEIPMDCVIRSISMIEETKDVLPYLQPCEDWDTCQIRLVAQLLALTHLDGNRSKSEAEIPELWKWWLNDVPSIDEFRAYHPSFGSNALLSYFEALPVVEGIRTFQEAIERRWRRFLAQGESFVSLNSWTWGEAVILSRAWGEKFMEYGRVMVPVLDMINTDYRSRYNLQVNFSNPSAVTVSAKTDILAGEELIARYIDDRDNRHFVSAWGFVLPGNPLVSPPFASSWCPEWTKSINDECSCSVPDQWQNESAAFCSLALLAMEQCRESNSAQAQRCWTKFGRSAPREVIQKFGMRIFFRNLLPDPVLLYWLPHDGQRQLVSELNSNDALFDVVSYPGHAFEAVRTVWEETEEEQGEGRDQGSRRGRGKGSAVPPVRKRIPAQSIGVFSVWTPGQMINISDNILYSVNVTGDIYNEYPDGQILKKDHSDSVEL